MKLLTQPGDGIASLVKGIDRAKKSVEIVIFRFDRIELERALKNAVKRGVSVHALIAYTNRGGDRKLRELEMRFLASGITVARTADDLLRYHGKMMLVDRKELYLLAFNFIYLDIERSRSFGVVTRDRRLVQEAVTLFECDTKRRRYKPGYGKFLVSPLNARKGLADFIQGAKKELRIYEMGITDQQMVRLLEDRAKAGVDIRIIGPMKRKISGVSERKLTRLRLHTRTMVRDGQHMFIGSQSLRELELDARREIGIIFRDASVIKSVLKTFRSDWQSTAESKSKGKPARKQSPARRTKAAKKVAKQVTRTVTDSLPAVAPMVEEAMQQVIADNPGVELDHKEVEETVRDAVKDAVKGAVREMVENATSSPDSDKE